MLFLWLRYIIRKKSFCDNFNSCRMRHELVVDLLRVNDWESDYSYLGDYNC